MRRHFLLVRGPARARQHADRGVRTELEDILRLPVDPTLDQLDSALRTFVSFCAGYHGA